MQYPNDHLIEVNVFLYSRSKTYFFDENRYYFLFFTLNELVF